MFDKTESVSITNSNNSIFEFQNHASVWASADIKTTLVFVLVYWTVVSPAHLTRLIWRTNSSWPHIWRWLKLIGQLQDWENPNICPQLSMRIIILMILEFKRWTICNYVSLKIQPGRTDFTRLWHTCHFHEKSWQPSVQVRLLNFFRFTLFIWEYTFSGICKICTEFS